MTFQRFRYWFGGVVPVWRFDVGVWPLVWLRPKVYRLRDSVAFPLGPFRFIAYPTRAALLDAYGVTGQSGVDGL